MIIGRKFRGAVVRSVDLDDCNSKCTGKSNLVKMLRSSFDTAAPDKDYPYNPPTASWWDEDIFKLMPTTAPPPKETTTKPPEVPTGTHNKEPASTMIPTTGQSVASSITVPASNDPRMIPSTTEKVPPAVRTSTPTIGEEVTAKTAQLPSKSSTLAATEAVTSSVTAPASKDPGMVPSTPEKVPPAIKTTDTTIEEEVTVTPAQLPSTLSTLAATEAASSFVTAPASEDPRMGPGTTMNVPRVIKTTTPAISEEVTVTPAQLPSKSSTLTVKEAASSTVSVPSSNDPRMVPSTTEKVPPAVKTSTSAIDEEVTMTPAQLPSELSTLAATEAATKKSTDEICREDNENALMPHESDCTKYYHCANSKPHLQKCARGTKPNYYTFCFWDGFSRFRSGPYKSSVSDIPAELCSAVVYSHVTIDEASHSIRLTDKELELDSEAKSYANSWLYNPIWLLPPNMVYYWKDMTESLAQWLRTYDFDGVVLDFFSGTTSLQDNVRTWEKAKFIHPFVRQINYDLREHKKMWSITLTLPAFDSTTHHLFDIESLTKEVNFFLVKSSDCLEFPKGALLNVTRTIDMTDIDRAELIVRKGAPRQRIVLEVPLFARTYTAMASATGVHTVFPGISGNYTDLQGFLASYEVCHQLQIGWQKGRSDQDSCPFLRKDEEYVAYEDDESVLKKANMVMGRKYRGAAVRSVDLDDYNSRCAGKSNLLRGLRSSFDAAKADIDYPYNPPTASWWNGDNDKFNCAPGTIFDIERQICNWPAITNRPECKLS
ncbi:hypothetical protein MRX96_021724 [Rhipicephalus microplus]